MSRATVSLELATFFILYFVPFLTVRTTLASSLAWMELYRAIAHLYRPGVPKIHLYETDETDVIPVHGLLFSMPRRDSPGVRAFLTKAPH